VVICLERGADLDLAQLMPLPLTVSCFSKIQIGFTFLVLAHLSSPRQRAVKQVFVVVVVVVRLCIKQMTVQWATTVKDIKTPLFDAVIKQVN